MRTGLFLPEHTKELEIHPKKRKAAMAAVLGASLRLWGALGWVGLAGATGGTCRHCVGFCELLL